ncbi:MAG: hypothetical protein JW959_08805, partial [Pirellulales bacterium]|nr:hypothetical protein [Pirellulales bacterium]
SPASGRGDGGEGGKILRKDESIRVSRVRAGTRHESAAESVRFTRPANPPKFVRRIEQPPKSIDLLDIVAGGNGMKGSKYIALVQTMPVGYWRFDEQPAGTQSTGAPGSLIDSTGNGHDGRTFGSPLPYYSSDVKGYPRSAIALTRKSDDNDAGEDCIVIPHHPDFNLRMADGVDYLIEADIKLSGFDYAGNHTPTIFSKGVGWNSYAFRVNTAGKLSLYIQGAADGTPSADICGNTAVNDGAWHHVAVLIDSNETDALSSATFYVDGKPDGAVVLRKNDGSAWTNENIDAASNADHGDEVLIGDYGDVSRETYYRKNYSQFVGSIGAVKFSLVPETATLPPDGGGPAGWDRLIGDDVFPDAGAATFGSVLLRAADDPQLDRTIISKLLAAPADREEKSPPAQPGLLFVRPNSNITVDLRALRKLYRGSRPISFKAVVGAAGGEADFRVLVDGQPKFIRTKLRTEDGPVEVNVELGPDDRLLRLVADGGNGGSAGWIVLGNPSLDITEIESEN